jgi:GDP-L-fucose synthase
VEKTSKIDVNSNIYVAGHTGLVGSAFLRALSAGGFKNVIVRTSRELDLRRQSEVEAFFEANRPRYVFLAAAKVGGILANDTYRADFIYDNIMIAANVIHASHKYGVEKLLNLGSSCIYPKLAPQPLREEYLLTGALEPTNEPYAVAKISAIKLCRYFNEQYGTDFISAMPTNLFGPNDNYDFAASHVLPALIRKFHLAKLIRANDMASIRADILNWGAPAGLRLDDDGALLSYLEGMGITADALTLWGTGEPYREFLHADDLAEACMFLMERRGFRDVGEFINVGAGKDLKVRELASIVKEVAGYGGVIKFDASKPDGTPRKVMDSSRMEALGWRAGTGLREGIKRTYEGYVRGFGKIS